VVSSRCDGDYEKTSIRDIGCIFRGRGRGDFEALEDREVQEVSVRISVKDITMATSSQYSRDESRLRLDISAVWTCQQSLYGRDYGC
jgi:hypothetical protein